MARYRAVVDVNVIVSGLMTTTGAPARILQAIQQGDVSIIVSPAFLAELHDVLHRPKFRRWFSVAVASRTVVEIRRAGDTYSDPPESTSVTRDPSDDYLVRLARTARADCLVTGDADLVDADLADVWVLRPATFLAELQPPPLMTEHFFYARRETAAAALLATLQRERVLALFGPSAAERKWLVKAYTNRTDEDDFDALVEHFTALASRHRCDYDGYGTYVGPLEALLPTAERPAEPPPEGSEPGG